MQMITSDNWQQLADQHYENFPIKLRFLPKNWRQDIQAIYAFARIADDLADEGELSVAERLAALDSLEHDLLLEPNSPIQSDSSLQPDSPLQPDSLKPDKAKSLFRRLHQTCQQYDVPINWFQKLLIAFRADAKFNQLTEPQHCHQTLSELYKYCQHSANPIGEILLKLTDNHSSQTVFLANKICTALQLLNFCQDAKIDILQKQRCYFPATELKRFDLDLPQVINLLKGEKISIQIQRQYQAFFSDFLQNIASLLQFGKTLPSFLAITKRGQKMFKWQIQITILAAELLLNKLSQQNEQCNWQQRPVISKFEFVKLAYQAY